MSDTVRLSADALNRTNAESHLGRVGAQTMTTEKISTLPALNQTSTIYEATFTPMPVSETGGLINGWAVTTRSGWHVGDIWITKGSSVCQWSLDDGAHISTGLVKQGMNVMVATAAWMTPQSTVEI